MSQRRRSPNRDPQRKAQAAITARRGVAVINQHVAPEAYGLLILAPEIALASGWLGGDRVVGRAAIRDLLKKAGRFNEGERQRMTIHLPDKAVTLRLDEVERQMGLTASQQRGTFS